MKQFIQTCHQRMDALCDRICNRMATHLERKKHSYQEFLLQAEVDRLRRDEKFLQLQLRKARADFHELQQRLQSLRDDIFQVLCMSDDKLREASRFHVQRNETGSWETVTGFCCLGGCDMDAYSFQSERDALLFSVLLKVVGYQPPHNSACPACYETYMSEDLQGGIETYVE